MGGVLHGVKIMNRFKFQFCLLLACNFGPNFLSFLMKFGRAACLYNFWPSLPTCTSKHGLTFWNPRPRKKKTLLSFQTKVIFQFSTYYFMSYSWWRPHLNCGDPTFCQLKYSLGFCSFSMTTAAKYISLRWTFLHK